MAAVAEPMGGREPDLPWVLVVDDEPLVRTDAVSLLTERGYRVREAKSVAEALDWLARHPEIRVMITDIALPDGDGWSLATQAVAANPDLRIIYASGVHGSADMGQNPHGRFLAKPYSPARLVIAVADALAD